jgi:hypothetical protein
MTIYRVEYPVAKAQARILEEGLSTSSPKTCASTVGDLSFQISDF